MNYKEEITNWRKAKASSNGAGCVEVGSTSEVVGVRDSTRREAGHFEVAPAQWAAFIEGVKAGDFELS